MRVALLLLMLATATTADASALINPDKLQAPSQPTCIDLKHPVAIDAYQTIFKYHRVYTLARGPYIAEKVDAKGTYYRAPPGGVAEKAIHANVTMDGGLYVPNDASAAVALYMYTSNRWSPAHIPPSDVDCSTVRYVRDPVTSRINLIAFGVGGAIGGATGATIARSTVTNSKLSYGKAAGAGAAGGLIAGLIVAAIVNHEMGKIAFIPGIKDQDSLRELKGLAASRVPLKQVEIAQPATGSRAAPPAASTH